MPPTAVPPVSPSAAPARLPLRASTCSVLLPLTLSVMTMAVPAGLSAAVKRPAVGLAALMASSTSATMLRSDRFTSTRVPSRSTMRMSAATSEIESPTSVAPVPVRAMPRSAATVDPTTAVTTRLPLPPTAVNTSPSPDDETAACTVPAVALATASKNSCSDQPASTSTLYEDPVPRWMVKSVVPAALGPPVRKKAIWVASSMPVSVIGCSFVVPMPLRLLNWISSVIALTPLNCPALITLLPAPPVSVARSMALILSTSPAPTDRVVLVSTRSASRCSTSLSLPRPPSRVSLPAPPRRLSSPAPPSSVSLPLLPMSVSSP